MEGGWTWIPASVMELLIGPAVLGTCEVPQYPDVFFLSQNIQSKRFSWVA